MTEVLRDSLLRRATSDPDGLAYTYEGSEMTFGQLAERAAARAAAMHRAGVRPGDRVAAVMSSGLPFVEVFWGCQLIGAVPAAINPDAPAERLERRAAMTRPALVITDDSAREQTGTAELSRLPDLSAEELAFLQLTSGTSGAPRAVMVRHRNVLGYLTRTTHLRAGDVAVSWMPQWHDFGLICFVISSVFTGAPCHLLPPRISSFPRWLRMISEVGGTITGGPDFAFRVAARMVKPSTVNLSPLRAAWSGGEPVRLSSIQQFEERFSAPGVVCPCYGQAEATAGVTLHEPEQELVTDARGNVTCGTPKWGFQVRAGPDLEHPEEIVVRGDPVFAGYLDAPEETAQVLRDGWLHTGDIGYLDADGRLFVLGRRAAMLKRGGGVIAPREVEEAALLVKDVRVAAATSMPSAHGNEDLIVVSVEADISESSEEQIAREVSRSVVAQLGFAPGRVRVMPRRAIPRTENGKIRHNRLRQALLEEVG